MTTFVVQHLVNGNHGTAVIHLRNPVGRFPQGIQSGITPDFGLQTFQISLDCGEFISILHKNGCRRVRPYCRHQDHN